MQRNLWLAAAMMLALALPSCALIGGYSSKSLEHVTTLKARHDKLIDDCTQGSTKDYDRARLKNEIDQLEVKFLEALEYSKALGDTLRTDNIELLHDIYKEDTALILSKRRLLSAEEANVLKSATDLAYQQAIKGEKVRKSSSNTE